MLKIEDAAVQLGIPAGEVRDVFDAPAGDVAVTADGLSYVCVPEDQPDGAGQTGWMLLAAPHEKYIATVGAGRLYVMPEEPDEPADAVLDKAGLQALARELGIEVSGRWGEARLQAEIDKALTGPAPDEDGQGSDVDIDAAFARAADLEFDEIVAAIAAAEADGGGV